MVNLEIPPVISLSLPLEPLALRPDIARDPTSVETLLAEADRLAIFPALFNNIRALGLADSLPADSIWLRRFQGNFVRNMTLEREGKQVVERLAGSGLPCRVVKGVPLARLLYPDLSWRQITDVDLLVPPAQVEDAYRLLGGFGLKDFAKPWNSESLSKLRRQPAYAFPQLKFLTARRTLVELHWDWVGEDFPPDDPAGDKEAFLVYLCRHAAKHFWSSLKWVCDIELFLRKFGDGMDWTRFWKLARESGSERSCAGSLHLSALMFQRPLKPHEQRLAARAGRSLSRRAARMLISQAPRGRWEHPALRLLRVYNWRQRISRCWSWLAPPPWHWNQASGVHRSDVGIWLSRYRRLFFQMVARTAPSRQWSQRLEKAADLSGRDWGFLVRAAATLLVVRVAMRTISFNRLQRWATAGRPGSWNGADQTREGVLRAAWLVDVAANHHVVPMRCLARSLTLAWLLGRRGVPTDLKLGVRTEDGRLLAHAWVEYQGERMNDHYKVAPQYTELAPSREKEIACGFL